MKTEQELPTRENEIIDLNGETFPDMIGMTSERFDEVTDIVENGYDGNQKHEEIEMWFEKLSKKELAVALQWMKHTLAETKHKAAMMVLESMLRNSPLAKLFDEEESE